MKINIAVSANSKYMRYLYVMLLSLFENNRENEITVYVMQKDFSVQDKECIIGLADKYGQAVEYIFVDYTWFQALPTTEKFSIETYFRLMMSELLPDSVEKLLYLDVDIIVQKDIASFYDTNISNYIAVVCQDMDHPMLEQSKRELFHRAGDMRYFNAGVMLWNMERLRKEYNFERFMKAAKDLDFRLQYVDQEILNYLLYDKVYYYNTNQYNFLVRGDIRQSDIEDEGIAILHYAGCNPWQNGLKNNLYKIWWFYANQTPFYIELLEEQVWRDIEGGEENNAVQLRDLEQREIYEQAFALKGTGRIRDWLIKSDTYLALYGAGAMAEVLYELLRAEDMWSRVVAVVDQKKSGKFHGVQIVKDISMGNVLIIVTPIFQTRELEKELKSRMNDKVKIVSMRSFLKNID